MNKKKKKSKTTSTTTTSRPRRARPKDDLGDPPGIWSPPRAEFADIALMKRQAEHDQNTWALYPEQVGDTWEAMFRVGNQGFYIGHGDRTKAHAEWWCERLAIALRHIGVSEKNRAAK